MGEHHSLVNVNYRCHFVGKHSFRCNWQQQCCRNQRKTSASKAVSLGSGRRYCSSCTSKSLSLHCLISEKRNFNTKKKQKKTFPAFIVSISLLKDRSEHHSMDVSLSLSRLWVLRRIFGFVKSYYALNVKFSKGEIYLRAERE